jgi:CheY-specific phosphatase CheX
MILPALDGAIKEVLERMFFVEALSELGPDETDAEPAVRARLTFQGTPPGWFDLRVTTAAARSIAADFLGTDEPASELRVEAVVCELANMICGSVLSQVESKATFRLGSPRIIHAEGCAHPSAQSTVHSVRIASGVLTAILTMEGPACLAAEKSVS